MRTSAAERKAQSRFNTQTRAKAFYENQVIGELNESMWEFVESRDMVFIATADAHGHPDCSLRAGSPGFVVVIDQHTLGFPEYRGNGVMASVGNILENPHIGMMFLDFYESTVGLHVNGKARVVATEQELKQIANLPAKMWEAHRQTGGRRPVCWVIVEVEEAYIHCSKHVPLLKKLPKHRQWGTDDESQKGGDFFRVLASKKSSL